MVTEIDGKPLVAGSEITLKFAEDGQVSGGASCNRYFGGVALTGENLAITNPGASMMMCDEPLMEQEGLCLAILSAVARFDIGTEGSLVLHAGYGRTIAGSRLAN